MKKINILLVILMLVSFGTTSIAQSGKGEEVRVPLSNPGQAGLLRASSHRGRITVEAHSGSDVIVTIYAGDDDDDMQYSGKKGGLKKISAGSYNAEISEEDNEVSVLAGSQSEVYMVIKVPRNFAVSVGTHHNGQVIVSGVQGVVEVNAHHGGIRLEDLGSSATANTHHGEIVATFTSVDSSKPMAFSTYHGDVDITLPGNSSFSTKIKTTKGDIYTDFEMDIQNQPNQVREKGGKTKIEIGGWRHANVGSGGEEYMMSTYHGDVIIRKN